MRVEEEGHPVALRHKAHDGPHVGAAQRVCRLNMILAENRVHDLPQLLQGHGIKFMHAMVRCHFFREILQRIDTESLSAAFIISNDRIQAHGRGTNPAGRGIPDRFYGQHAAEQIGADLLGTDKIPQGIEDAPVVQDQDLSCRTWG